MEFMSSSPKKVMVTGSGGLIVRRLRGGMDDEVWAFRLQKIAHALAVANVEILVTVTGQGGHKVLHDGAGGAGRSKELLAHVVIHTHYAPTFFGECAYAIGADKTAGSGN